MAGADPTRRRLLEASVIVTAGGFALALGLPGAHFLATPLLREEELTWVDLGELAGLVGAGAPLAVRFRFETWRGYTKGAKPGLLWVVPDADEPSGVRVLSAVCSHKGCNVAWSPEEELFACPCHKGRFAPDGAVHSGPPTAPLPRAKVRVQDGHLWAEIGASLA